MPLTIAEVRNAKPREKAFKLADEKGLYLFVTPSGAKSWRFKYRFGPKEKLLTFGLFPEVSIAEARERRDAARAVLRENKDPGIEAVKQRDAAVAAAGATFKVTAQQWHQDETPRWSARHTKVVKFALERDVFPEFGSMPIADIDGPLILRALRKIERRGSIETAKRVLGYVSAIFERAKSEHLVKSTPALGLVKALKPTPKGSKQPAITDLPGLLNLQRVIDTSTAGP